MTDGPVLLHFQGEVLLQQDGKYQTCTGIGPIEIGEQEPGSEEQTTHPMLALSDVESHFTHWLTEHPSIAAHVGEDIGLTVYLAGVVHGITIAQRTLMLERQASGSPATEERGGEEPNA